MLKYSIIKLIVFVNLTIYLTFSINNGLGKTPPMGWTNSNIQCNINQTIIQQTTDKLINSQLARKGYQYINLKDCWQGNRNQTTGQIQQDFNKFPNGINSLKKYLANKGFKLALGSDLGDKTCSNKSGSYGLQKIDSLTYAKWGVDYLEYTNCNHLNTSKFRYVLMSKYLNQNEQPIFYSISDIGNDRVWEWGQNFANSWRTVGDIQQNWNSIASNIQKQAGLEKYAQAGGWNDPGLLQVGNKKLSFNEQYAQFAMWCALKAPLFIRSDINSLSNQELQILGNEQLIAVNQDSLGIQAKRIKAQIGSNFKRQVWGGQLSNNNFILIFLNRGQTETTIEVSLKNEVLLQFSSYTQRDPVRHTNVGISNKDILSYKVTAHSVEVRILSLAK